MKKYKSVISVDVEDTVNVGFLRYFGQEVKPTFRVVENTEKLLKLFSKKNIIATFFILGEVAEIYPELIKKISNAGHELGVHGYKHRFINSISPEKTIEEIKVSKNLIEDISGQQVYGYRAPYLSIDENSVWMIEALKDIGFLYDSSIVNNFLPKYFKVNQNNFITKIKLNQEKCLFEIPPTSFKILGRNLTLLSGNYLRVLPFSFIKTLYRNNTNKKPIIIYIHPYEIDSRTPPPALENKIKQSSLRTKFEVKVNRYNRNKLCSRIDHLLNTYKYTSMINLIKESSLYNNS